MAGRPLRRARRNSSRPSRQQLYAELDRARIEVDDAISKLDRAALRAREELPRRARERIVFFDEIWRMIEAQLLHDINGRR